MIQPDTHRPFIVVSGLPASGKSTVGRNLSNSLDLPLLDKDDYLTQLFESEGVGDLNWRRRLSRKSDELFKDAAQQSSGAVLVSWWRLPDMDSQSGTPIDWLHSLSYKIVQVHCVCEPEIAARRFFERERHPGHLDSRHSLEDVIASTKQLSKLESFEVGIRLDINTTEEPDYALLAERAQQMLDR
jgi:hypothetical protein